MSENTLDTGGWPGAASLKDTIPDGWHTTTDAAKLVGRDPSRLKAWHKDGTFSPSGYTDRGELRIALYSDDDIEKLKEIAANKRPGRKPQDEGVDEDES